MCKQLTEAIVKFKLYLKNVFNNNFNFNNNNINIACNNSLSKERRKLDDLFMYYKKQHELDDIFRYGKNPIF